MSEAVPDHNISRASLHSDLTAEISGAKEQLTSTTFRYATLFLLASGGATQLKDLSLVAGILLSAVLVALTLIAFAEVGRLTRVVNELSESLARLERDAGFIAPGNPSAVLPDRFLGFALAPTDRSYWSYLRGSRLQLMLVTTVVLIGLCAVSLVLVQAAA